MALLLTGRVIGCIIEAMDSKFRDRTSLTNLIHTHPSPPFTLPQHYPLSRQEDGEHGRHPLVRKGAAIGGGRNVSGIELGDGSTGERELVLSIHSWYLHNKSRNFSRRNKKSTNSSNSERRPSDARSGTLSLTLRDEACSPRRAWGAPMRHTPRRCSPRWQRGIPRTPCPCGKSNDPRVCRCRGRGG